MSVPLNGVSETGLICHGKMKSLGCGEDFYNKDKGRVGDRSEMLAKP